MLEHIILGFLMTKDRSGYDLKWLMENSTSYFINASFGSVYPALKRLAQKNLVTLHEAVEGGKYKKMYRITDSGKAAFLQWAEEPIVFERSKQDHLAKIFFYEFIPKETAIGNLKDLAHQVESVAKELTGQKSEKEREVDIYKYYYRYAAMCYGVEYYDFVLRWCGTLIDRLENDPETARSERQR